jgi:nucleotide-binding universal stress UspA family protein
MYKLILVPLDGSRRAEAILPHAAQLAQSYGSEIVFLRVFEIPHLTSRLAESHYDFEALPYLSNDELQELVGDARGYLDGLCSQMADAGIRARYKVEHGPIAATIINTAVEEQADLIAMASHGSSGLQGVYYGSVAAGVLQRVDRPLLIVRAYEIE